ncbi:hypothetical protein F0L68_38845 [Solihabitans fulvus]|uniref:Uncharacterized protein n=1 Tax=Solihabitans fulvus TaxID=1892852 RepID=A0A5B2WKW7_9PSEU|nr:hypothetical protein F0L68_38845 [Solihabitans fulvus]
MDRLQPRLHELAAALAAVETFRSARLVEARRRAADDWIATHHTEGLRMPAWWIKELVAAVTDHPGKQLSLV